MKVIAVANQKGGCAKTTSTVNLAACLGAMGERVLVVDLDPQGSASLHLGIEDDGAGLLKHFEEPAPLDDLIKHEVAKGVDLVPAGIGLATVDLRLTGKIAWEKRLKRCLAKTAGKWSWVLIDCPPGLGFLTVNALLAADAVLIPVQSTALSIAGLRDLMATIDQVRDEDHPSLQIAGILPCQAHPRRVLHRQAIDVMETDFPGFVAPLVIRENAAVAEAAGHSVPVIQYDPSSNGAEDYMAAAKWLKERML